MEGDNGGRREAAAVLLLLCALAQNVAAFSLQELHKTVQPEQIVSETAEVEVGKGVILFNGEELELLSGSTPVSTNKGVNQPDDETETLEQLETVVAWRRLNTSLHCGDTEMKLNAFGPGAADFQVDNGNADPYPLIQVPEACDYSIQQNAQGLALIVPFNGCNVILENGEYVLPLIWQNTPVQLVCPMSAESEEPSQDDSLQSPTSNRPKRHTMNPLSMYDPWNPYHPYFYYYYYMHLMSQKPSPAAAAPTTASPTVKKPAQMTGYNPYQQYPQYVQYSKPGYTSQNFQNPIGVGMNTQALRKPSYPQKYHPYHPAAQPVPGTPETSGIYYYPIIQHFYGQKPTATTKPPTTTKPCETTTTKSPCTASTCKKPTTSPCTASTCKKPTTSPCTASTCKKPTTSPCTASTCKKPTTTSVGKCFPGMGCPFRPFEEQPFKPVVSFSRARAFPEVEKYAPEASYKSAPQARAHPGYQWENIPWVSSSSGQEQFHWRSL